MNQPELLETPEQVAEWSKGSLKEGKSIGLVPTMGALHFAHRSLIERARQENDLVSVSIFVNPTQFGPGEDLDKYPRMFDADLELCAELDVDMVYHPDVKDMYDKDHRTWVEVGGLADNLCGLSRPGHFRGVATVVTKLIALARPDRAYFGLKDYQQWRIIQTMVRDLNLGCEVVGCPTVREPDGLAVSSRNQYLSNSERRQALCLSQCLDLARKRIAEGERDGLKLLGELHEFIDEEVDTEIDYISIADAHTLADLVKIEGDIVIAMAVNVGRTRLIDNCSLTV